MPARAVFRRWRRSAQPAAPAVRKEPEGMKATFSKGMLEIRIPKVEPRPIAKIAVKTA